MDLRFAAAEVDIHEVGPFDQLVGDFIERCVVFPIKPIQLLCVCNAKRESCDVFRGSDDSAAYTVGELRCVERRVKGVLI